MDTYTVMYHVLQVSCSTQFGRGVRGAKPPGKAGGFGGPLGPPTFAWLPRFRIYPVRTGCPALRFTWLPNFLLPGCCPVLSAWPGPRRAVYAVTLEGSRQRRKHISIDCLRLPFEIKEPCELYDQARDCWLFACTVKGPFSNFGEFLTLA